MAMRDYYTQFQTLDSVYTKQGLIALDAEIRKSLMSKGQKWWPWGPEQYAAFFTVGIANVRDRINPCARCGGLRCPGGSTYYLSKRGSDKSVEKKGDGQHRRDAHLICGYYNGKGGKHCKKGKGCNRKHICSSCKGNHPATRCNESKKDHDQ